MGEALAEIVISDLGCFFPWPSGRDAKNPAASDAGTDLVGFHATDESVTFAFGEVKTSSDPTAPPSATYGRHGLKEQIERLHMSFAVRRDLVTYLGFHAQGTHWEDDFRSAAQRFLTNDLNLLLFGVLIRDTDAAGADVAARVTWFQSRYVSGEQVLFLAIYLPPGAIETLATAVTTRRQPT